MNKFLSLILSLNFMFSAYGAVHKLKLQNKPVSLDAMKDLINENKVVTCELKLENAHDKILYETLKWTISNNKDSFLDSLFNNIAFNGRKSVIISRFFKLSEDKKELDLAASLVRKSLKFQDQKFVLPIHIACKERMLNIVRYLVNNVEGIDFNATTNDNKTPLDLAILSCDIVEMADMQSLLMGIADLGFDRIKERFIKSHSLGCYLLAAVNNLEINSNKKNVYQMFLAAASLLRQNKVAISIIDFLCKDNTDHSEFLSMQVYCNSSIGNFELVKYLVDNCKTLNFNYLYTAETPNGETPLQVAYRKKYINIVAYLMNNVPGLDISTFDNNIDLTELFTWACELGQIKVIHNILKNSFLGFNNKDEKFGATGLHYACANGYLDVVKLLISYLYCDHPYMIREKEQIDINATTETGATPLHYACKYGHTDIVKYLVSSCPDLDINAQTNKGRVAIQIAEKFGRLEIVEYLRSIQN